MIIKTLKINKQFYFITTLLSIIIILTGYFFISKSVTFGPELFWNNYSDVNPSESSNGNFIKWVNFNITSEALSKTAKLDITSHNSDSEIKYNWIELLSYLACKNGGNFKNFKQTDLDKLVDQLQNGKSMQELTQNMKYYNYYFNAYSAVLSGFIGNYSIEVEDESGTTHFEDKYGIKAFLPIAKNYNFSHYDDFGASRSYGFKRTHLGNDLMGSIGTPIIAVESGTVEHLGWNQYGGWRVGIRSLDGKRYYYYAHLRKDKPYFEGIEKGVTVAAGQPIGYLGVTGYSVKENVNMKTKPHLHIGLQLIFDESQVDGNGEIWIDLYSLTRFWQNCGQHASV